MKKIALITILLMATTWSAFAASDYSFKDFTNQDLTDFTDFDNQTIEGSCFSHEIPDSHVFPDHMTGVTLIDCNLDNVFIPPGNIVKGGSQRRFKVQNDGEDWLVDTQDKPTEPIDKDTFKKLDVSIDPRDIPVEKTAKSVIQEKLQEKEAAKSEAIAQAVANIESQP